MGADAIALVLPVRSLVGGERYTLGAGAGAALDEGSTRATVGTDAIERVSTCGTGRILDFAASAHGFSWGATLTL